MNYNKIKKNILISLAWLYAMIAMFLALDGSFNDIIPACLLVTLLILKIILGAVIIICLLPPVWIFVIWYLFKKQN